MSEKSISAEEVAKHNTKDSLWIIIDGNVYDVTEWQNTHPGGKRMLQKVGGQDASKKFHSYHDTAAVLRKYGDKFRIGKLADVEANPASASTELVMTTMRENSLNAERQTQMGISLLLEMNKTAAAVPAGAPAGAPALPPFGDQIPFADPMWYQGYYSPYYGEKHARIRSRVRKWLEENVVPHLDDWEEQGGFPPSLYRDFAQAGWLAYCTGNRDYPSKYFPNKHADICPDAEVDAFVGAAVSDEVCRIGSGALVWFLSGGFLIGLPPVMNFARPEVRDRVIPQVMAGNKRICLCITEPRGGSDVANLETTAEKTADGKHYIVNGVKKWITNGMFADFFSVAVRTGGPGMNGVSMLLVEKTFPGVSVRKITTQGMTGTGTAFVEFDDVKVPVENLIGAENQGFKVIMSNFNHERIAVIVQAVRFARVCFEDAIRWSFQRKTFGKPLFGHDVIRNKLAQMASKIEAAQASLDNLLYQDQCMTPQLASLKLGGPIAGLKAFSTQMLEYVAREASQIFGGLAYTRGGKGGRVERIYRDVRALAIPGGSEEIMLDLAIRQSVKVQKHFGAKL